MEKHITLFGIEIPLETDSYDPKKSLTFYGNIVKGLIESERDLKEIKEKKKTTTDSLQSAISALERYETAVKIDPYGKRNWEPLTEASVHLSIAEEEGSDVKAYEQRLKKAKELDQSKITV
jgi:hypothetical protein